MTHRLNRFVDPHCHLFNVADIPIRRTAIRLQGDFKHPLKALFLVAAPYISLEKLLPFLEFFESEPRQNLVRLTGQVSAAHQAAKIKCGEVIFTPLAMNFDLNGDVDKHGDQMRRLVSLARDSTVIKVLPFVGLDPRSIAMDGGRPRTDEEIKQHLDEFLSKYEVLPFERRIDPGNLSSGDVIGLKLYPPLGFDVYPEDPSQRHAHASLYEHLAARKIPLTVHCQPGSFELTKSEDETRQFTDPVNWAEVLSTGSGHSELRINFAHFGGDQNIKDTIRWKGVGRGSRRRLEADGVSRDTWTFRIIEILKRYPNSFSDLSALDFTNREATAAVSWIIAWDKEGRFDDLGEYPLLEKLMWGSDYPMVLRSVPDYQSYFGGFMDMIGHPRRRFDIDRSFGYGPPPDRMPAPEESLRHLCEENPMKFLFGS